MIFARTISVPYWTIALDTAANVNEAINTLSFARIPADFRVRKIAFVADETARLCLVFKYLHIFASRILLGIQTQI